MTAVKFRKSKYFDETFAKYEVEAADKFKEFVKTKSEDPMSKFGAKDTHFNGDAPLGKTGVIHAHLTRDLSILYRRSGKNPTFIDLLVIGSHADLGTGTPANIKKQKAMAKKIDDMVVENKLPDGTYSATASGYESVVVHGGKSYVFKFDNGVRGLNIRDTITLSNGEVRSGIVGVAHIK